MSNPDPMTEARKAMNASLRGTPTPTPTPIPQALSDALEREKAAHASGDVNAITLAEQETDSIGAAIGATPPGGYQWGQGARGTGSQSNVPDMNSAIRTARYHPAVFKP